MPILDDPLLDAFRAEVERNDEDIDLAGAALAGSLYACPDLIRAPVLRQFDTMARIAAPRIHAAADESAAVQALLDVVLRAPGLRGADGADAEQYYDPRNSFLHEVLDRGVGIPIALAIILISVGARVGLPLGGTSMPMHFLVRVVGARPALLIDCYDGGQLLGEPDCRTMLARLSQGRAAWRADMIDVIANTAVLTRWLNNLKLIYLDEEDLASAALVLNRLRLLNPELPSLARERGLVLYRLQVFAAARRDLEEYLAMAGTAADAPAIRQILERMS